MADEEVVRIGDTIINLDMVVLEQQPDWPE